MKKKCRVIAFYLPQFYPTKENDEWWGKGFTEWTSVAKAKSFYKRQVQPKVPGELGFYDLRIPETRKTQTDLAREHGVDGFCYWHYWFGDGKVLLDMPFKELLKTKEPDFPFCLAWANITWGGLPYGDQYERILIEQKYNGIDDYTAHFQYILPAIKDKRYLKINGKPIFIIYNPKGLPNAKEFIDLWNNLALKEDLKGFYFIAYQHFGYDYSGNGFEALIPPAPSHVFSRIQIARSKKFYNRLFFDRVNSKIKKIFKKPSYYYHKEVVDVSKYDDISKDIKFFPNVTPNWDHTPRSGYRGSLIIDPNPDLFYKNLCNCFERIKDHEEDERVIFIKAWNEWGEGNYLEPDIHFKRSFLESIKKFVFD